MLRILAKKVNLSCLTGPGHVFANRYITVLKIPTGIWKTSKDGKTLINYFHLKFKSKGDH